MTGSLRRDNKPADPGESAAPVEGGVAAASGWELSSHGEVRENADEALAATIADDAAGSVVESDAGSVSESDAGSAAESDAGSALQSDAGSAPTTKTLRWLPAPSIRKGYGGSSVSFALAGLATSFFVGWAFPLALVGIALGIVAVRKPEESSRLGAWGITLGALATIYSAGWLWWAGTQLHWFG